jgi:hypothetical protein
MQKLGIAGDSFMALDSNYPNTHFTEILSNTFSCDLINLAKGGGTNFLIYHQVRELIKQNPSFIIIGFTTYGRTEIGLDQRHSEFYDTVTVEDFNRTPVDGKSPRFFFNSIDNLINTDQSELSIKEIKLFENFKEYFLNVYNKPLEFSRSLAFQIATLALVEQSKIPYVFYSIAEDPYFTTPPIDSKYIPIYSPKCPWNYTNGYAYAKPRYHTLVEAQKLLADYYLPLVENYLKPELI